MWECEKVKCAWRVGPGLAQLVEHLDHRYSESTSSNPGNLTSATVCGDRTGCTGCQEVGKCSTRGESWGMFITFTSAMRIRQPTLALKPRGDVTRNPNRGTSGPKKGHVSAKNFKNKSVSGDHSKH